MCRGGQFFLIMLIYQKYVHSFLLIFNRRYDIIITESEKMRVRRNSYEEDSFGGLVSRAAHANASFRQYGVLNRIGCVIWA